MATEETINDIKSAIERLNNKARYAEELDAVLRAKLGYASIAKSLHLIPDEGARYRLEVFERDLERLASERVNVPMKDSSFIRIQRDYELVNEEQAERSKDAAIIGVSAGDSLDIPIYVYFFTKGDDVDEDTRLIETIMANKYPKFKLALEIEASQKGIEFSRQGFRDNKVMTYVCAADDAKPFLEHLRKCYKENHSPIKSSLLGFDLIYREGDIDAATHQQD